ncbi:MAG: aldo/keto reductase [Desulfovibrio sp.]|nr:aldo/keto reductase [Desulfovibrio sp.]
MHYRSLGRCGLNISEIGLGCEGLLGKPESFVHEVINMMEEHGGTGIDLYAPNPDMRSALGRALRGRRDKFLLEAHICTIWKDGQYKRTRRMDEVRISFDDQLVRLGTDYVEIGMIHYVDSLDDWRVVAEGEVLRYALDLKKAGTIRAIGLSSHNPQVALAAVNSDMLDVLLFSVNPCYDLQPAAEDVEQLWNREKYKGNLVNMNAERQCLYETCQRRAVGITVMKAFGGGDLLHADRSLAGVGLSPYQCLAYALDRPGVASVFAGAHSLEELQQNLTFSEAPDKEKDYATVLASFPRISWKGHCMYCGHCAPCPSGIDVAAVTKLLNLGLSQESVPETVREHYASLEHTGGECLQCGSCEDRCPFAVAAMQNMARAAQLFGK